MPTATLQAALDSTSGASPRNLHYVATGSADFGNCGRTASDSLTLNGPTPADSNKDASANFYFQDDASIPMDAIIQSVNVKMVHRAQGADINIGTGANPYIFQCRWYFSGSVGDFFAGSFDGEGTGNVDNTAYETWTRTMPFKSFTSTPWTRADLFSAYGSNGQIEIQSFTNPSENGDDVWHQIDRVYVEVVYITAAPSGTHITGWYESIVPGIRSGNDAELVTNTTPPVTTIPVGPRGMFIQDPFTESNPLWGHPGHAVALGNKLYYAAGGYLTGTDLPSIRVWDGRTDTEVCKIPRGPTGAIPTAITCMIPMTDRYIAIGVWDSGNNSTNLNGRVLRLRVSDGSLLTLGWPGAVGHIPNVLYYRDLLLVGTHRGDNASAGGAIWRTEFDITSLAPGSPAWVEVVTPATLAAANQGSVVSMAQPILAQGDNSGICFGTTAPAGQRGKVNYLNYRSGAGNVVLTGSGGTAQNWNGFYAISPFMPAPDHIPAGTIRMIAAYWNPDATPISKIICNNAGSDTVYTDSTGTQIMSIVVDGKIFDAISVGDTRTTGTTYAFGARRVSGVYTGLVVFNKDPEDLTLWTDATARLVLSNDDVTLSSRAPTNAFGSITL